VPETYGVDARARRYSRMLGGAVQEYYVYEGMDRVAVVGPNNGGVVGPLLESYLFDSIDHPLRMARPGASTNYDYYEVDLAGNVRGLRASGGASLGGYRYSAFGQTLEDTSLITQPLRWKGRWFSPVAGGTYDVRARQWSPELGAFLAVDGYEYHDAKGTLWSWPNQNPARFMDPSGQDASGGGKSGGGGSTNDWGDCNKPQPGCPACPTPPPNDSRRDTDHSHWPCAGAHTHHYRYEYNQSPNCECHLKKIETHVTCG
jgi:RHS repeat-associated protein